MSIVSSKKEVRYPTARRKNELKTTRVHKKDPDYGKKKGGGEGSETFERALREPTKVMGSQ